MVRTVPGRWKVYRKGEYVGSATAMDPASVRSEYAAFYKVAIEDIEVRASSTSPAYQNSSPEIPDNSPVAASPHQTSGSNSSSTSLDTSAKALA